MEHRGGHVEQPAAVDELVAFEPRAGGDEDPLRPMPDGDAGGYAGSELRPQVVAVEAVVGDDDDGRVGAGQLHEPAEKQVVKPVGGRDDPSVQLEVGLRDALHPRRVVGHEAVADLVDRPVVDCREVPVGLGLEKVRGGVVDRAGLGEPPREHPGPLVLRLVDGMRLGDEEPDDAVGVDLVGADPQVVHHVGQARRPVGARGRGGPRGGVVARPRVPQVAEHVGDDAAGVVLLAVRGEPPDDVALQPAVAEHLPESAALPRGGRDGHDRAGLLVNLGESRHAVVVGHLPRGDARPEHGGELRLERRQVAAGARLHEPCQPRHLAGVEQRVDDLPVGRVPADEQEPAAGHRVALAFTRGPRLPTRRPIASGGGARGPRSSPSRAPVRCRTSWDRSPAPRRPCRPP